MDDAYFQSALKSLTKTQHKRRLLQILMAIREGTNNVDRVKKLHRVGSLKYIVSCLQRESRAEVDLCLSILGNCCYFDVNCAKSLVQQHKILPLLCQLLEKYKDDSIRGRVFRIAGNLSDITLCRHIVDKEPNIITEVVQFLKEIAEYNGPIENVENLRRENATKVYTDSTIILALRITRKLLNKNTIDKLLMQHEVLKVIGKLLIKHTKLWLEETKYEAIINELVKIIYLYSDYKNAICVLQLKNTDSGDALVSVGELVLNFPDRVVKIFTNLMKACLLKSDIPIKTTANALMSAITESKKENEGTVNMLYLKALCKICEQSGCREEVKNAEVIPFLVGILKGIKLGLDSSYEHFHYILTSIIMCKFDYSLVVAQVKSGIIEVFTDALQTMYGDSTNIKVKHKPVRKHRSLKLSPDSKKPKSMSEIQNISMDWSAVFNSKNHQNNRPGSPSCSSDDLSSSPSSPQYPLLFENESLSDSDNYSPICSDNEDTDKMDITNGDEEGNQSDTEHAEFIIVPESKSNTLYFLVKQEIHSLLKWYTTMKPTLNELTDPNLIIVLTKAATNFTDPFNVSFDALINILSIQECLLPLMNTDYIPTIYSLSLFEHSNDCTVCVQLYDQAKTILNRIRKLAESGVGRGEIAHLLLRSKDKVKKEKLAISIPYIIGNKSMLRNLLINCEGLEIFTNVLRNNEDLREICLRGICELATTSLKIRSPSKSSNIKPTVAYEDEEFQIPSICENIVTFKLDDGSLVQADRDFLSQNCDYFNRLLSGHFKESHENIINLPNVGRKALNMILRFLSNGIYCEELFKFDELKVVLEAITLADLFILLDLRVYLVECVEQSHLNALTVPQIYQWSIESGTDFLRVECIVFALVGEVTRKERFFMFQKLFNLGYTELLVNDINNLLTQFLGQCS